MKQQAIPKREFPLVPLLKTSPTTWTCPVCGAGKEAFGKIPAEDIHAGSATTVSDVMVAELVAWGVNLVFGLPGTSSLGIVEAIRKNPGYPVYRRPARGECGNGCFGIQ